MTTFAKFRVPLVNVSERFEVELGGRSLIVRSRWNDVAGSWFIDLFDGKTGDALLLSMPLVAGVDLLGQYRHLGIPGHLVAFTQGDPLAAPTFENLGLEGRLSYAIEVP